jgi:hypothetical protein
MMTESLRLKWGTIKGWSNLTEASGALLKEYFSDGVPTSCMDDHPDDRKKAILCKLIDQLDGEIQNDWSGEMMSKEEAKKYVLEYGVKR